MNSKTNQLRQLLAESDILTITGCHDALSAHLAEQAGFPAVFMSGFAVSATRLAMPDTGLISFGEMLDQGRNIANAIHIPLFGDGDTGFGNAMNIKRTVREYAQAGFACIMLEDQVNGHTRGKSVVDREEALLRIHAAIDARNEGADILIMARTDARATHGIDEAIARCQAFIELGADITFLEAPESIDEMQRYCLEVSGHKMVNLIEHGKTPILPRAELVAMGYKISVYPLTLLNVSIKAIREALIAIQGENTSPVLPLSELTDAVGFSDYYAEENRYKPSN